MVVACLLLLSVRKLHIGCLLPSLVQKRRPLGGVRKSVSQAGGVASFGNINLVTESLLLSSEMLDSGIFSSSEVMHFWFGACFIP